MSYDTSWYKYKGNPITDIIGTSYTSASSNTFKPYFPSGPNTNKTDDRLDIGYSGTNFIAQSRDHVNSATSQSIPTWCKTMKVLMYSGGGAGGSGDLGAFVANDADYAAGGGGGGAGGERLFTNINVNDNSLSYNITIGEGEPQKTLNTPPHGNENNITKILYNEQNYQTNQSPSGQNGYKAETYIGTIEYRGGEGGQVNNPLNSGNAGNNGNDGAGRIGFGTGVNAFRGTGGNGGTINNLSNITITYDTSNIGKGGNGGMGGKGTYQPLPGNAGTKGAAKVYFFP
jgi:hypothetical protein